MLSEDDGVQERAGGGRGIKVQSMTEEGGRGGVRGGDEGQG